MPSSIELLLGGLAVLSFVLLLWQTGAAWKFPLHRRVAPPRFQPAVTLLKPLKGIEPATLDCLRSWLDQKYNGPVQVLFGVADQYDPICELVCQLIKEYPQRDIQLLICPESLGANAKVSTLIQLERQVRYSIMVMSDADVQAPPDLLSQVVIPLQNEQVGLVNCFYRLANPTNWGMRWEAVAINADFWSQVLQGRTLWPMDYALGAVMVTTRHELRRLGGLAAIADYLADDFQLGHLIARQNSLIALSPVVVECWSKPMTWRQVWHHQLRWARTIRVCKPGPYAASLLSNATLWPLLGLIAWPQSAAVLAALGAILIRIGTAHWLQSKLSGSPAPLHFAWLVPLKDLLQALLWVCSWTRNEIEWRGQRYRIHRDGKLSRR